MNYHVVFSIRAILAIVMIAGAIWSITVMASGSGYSISRVSHVVFWTLVPPLWFFGEYYAIDQEGIVKPGTLKTALLDSVRNYADYSSKIWAAVLAVVALLFAKS